MPTSIDLVIEKALKLQQHFINHQAEGIVALDQSRHNVDAKKCGELTDVWRIS